MKTKIANAVIIKNFDEEPFLGEIIIQDDKIEYVGKNTDEMADAVIDAKNNVVMPGFVDANCQSASVLFDLSKCTKQEEFDAQMVQRQKLLLASDVCTGTEQAIVQLVKSGVTSVGEDFCFADQSAKAFCQMGLRANISIKQRFSPKKFLTEQEAKKLFEDISKMDGIVTANFSCNSVLNDTEEAYACINKLASQNSTFVASNACTTLEEVGKCATQNGDLSPVELLEQYGFFDRKALVLHMTNASPKDLQILAKNGASMCANFSNDYALANGIAPIYQAMQYGINVCLGTGNHCTGGKFDMFREMYLAFSSQKVLLSDGGLLIAKDVLKMATINGAKALNLNVGELSVGKCADIVILDKTNLDFSNLFQSIVLSCAPQDVLLTMCAGKVLWDGKKCHFAKTEQSISKKYQAIKQRLKSKEI